MTLYIGGKNCHCKRRRKKNLMYLLKITDDRTFVPLRFVSENCGAVVAWDDSTKSVYITMPNNIPSSPGEILPTVERKSLGSEFKYKDLAVSFDEIIIEEIEKTNDVKITVKRQKPILKIPLFILELYNASGRSVKVRAFAIPSQSDTHKVVGSVFVSKSFCAESNVRNNTIHRRKVYKNWNV